MSLTVTEEKRNGGIFVIKPEGHLDSTTYTVLEKKLEEVIQADTKGLIFDLEKLEYISSAGVRVVLAANKKIEASNGTFMMTNLQPQIKKVFDIIEALPSMAIFQSIEEVDAYLDAMQRKAIEE